AHLSLFPIYRLSHPFSPATHHRRRRERHAAFVTLAPVLPSAVLITEPLGAESYSVQLSARVLLCPLHSPPLLLSLSAEKDR
uniref:Uncharacterized protein n=1 Tax=Aegilops tauschii subsp. strangulata TaxID=200361 RepID=A0A453G7N3_AEGTS